MTVAFKQGVFADAEKVRQSVFVEEQGFSNEFDSLDDEESVIHLTAYVDGVVAGCARVFPAELEPALASEEGRWVLGRLAVVSSMRGSGLGSQILAEGERVAQDAGAREMHLHAQCAAVPFYERAGYIAYGPIEWDEHVKHRWMRKRL